MLFRVLKQDNLLRSIAESFSANRIGMKEEKTLHFFSRIIILGFFALMLSGTNYCQENYNIGAQFRAETGTPTATPTSGAVDDDDNDPNDDGTEEDDDGTDSTASPSPTASVGTGTSPDATVSPSPSVSPSPGSATTQAAPLFDALARLSTNGGAKGASGSSAQDEPVKFDVGSVTDKFGEIAGEAVGGAREDSSSGDRGTWLGNLYDSEEIQGVSLDSDGDGFTDKLERDYGSDPLSSASTPPAPITRFVSRLKSTDTDLDGLSNEQEAELGTNPETGDSDGDGIRDGTEVVSNSNPNDRQSVPGDMDGDGLDTEYENEIGLNPQKGDTDEDGLRDDLELVVGSNPMDNDTDKDGILDGKEIAYGADPVVPESNLNSK